MEEITYFSCPQMTTEQVDCLREAKIKTFMDFIYAPKEKVISTMKIENKEYTRLRRSVLRYLQLQPITLTQIATPEVLKMESTGIPSLDTLLGGGSSAGDVIELYGKTGSGKTQMCMYLAALTCSRNSNSTVMYFDLKNDFYANRFLELCGGDVAKLENVMVYRAANLSMLSQLFDDIRRKFTGGLNGFYQRCKLMVIDSVPIVMYPAVGSEKYSWRYHQERFLSKLQWFADHMKLTVILVNHAVSSRAISTVPVPKVYAALGKYWQHQLKIRILLSKLRVLSNSSNYYSGCLEKCSRGPHGGTFYFCIKNNIIQELTVKPGENDS